MSSNIASDAALRLNYHDGMFLTSGLMTVEQAYFVNWLTLQNRMLYTAGVLEGLQASGQNKTVTVQGGAGVDAGGHFLIFPGDSNNTLSVGSTPLNPFGVYLCYPPLGVTTSDTVNTAAVLQAGDPSGNGTNGIILAEVSLDANGNIATVTDRRVAVTSRLPAILDANGTTPQVDLRAAKRGTVSFAAQTLARPGASSKQTVYFVAADTQAFASPPQVYISVGGSVPLSAEVAAVDTHGFALALTALQPSTATAPIVVSWLALLAS